MKLTSFRKTPLALAVSSLLLHGAGAFAWESDVHVFSIDDVMGGFDGTTFGDLNGTGAIDRNIICDLGDTPCPAENQPFLDKSGVRLYPVDTEFGYYIVDFLGAQQKARDGDYGEGWVGNITDGDTVIGIQISNAPTEKYKVKPPLGTWCQGLGGTSVKCETEHYTVMEHVLSCYETIPYFFADPETGAQSILSTPDGSLTFDCAGAPLDDNTLILENGLPGDRLTNATPCDAENDPAGCQMFPNDKTDMLNDIALSTDYSVQLKDDGKPLYGWGALHKRPNDVRMYAKMDLPEDWYGSTEANEGRGLEIYKAELVINHWVTNNPNDQLRPEDLENEAATGRKPSYRVEGANGSEIWKSTIECYEGDGDFIEGETPASPIGIGTVLKNGPFALDPAATPGDLPADNPYAFSSDLVGAFTNAYYTTINRDPFEWSYVNSAEAAAGLYNFVGSRTPLSDEEIAAAGLELVSGPRWRLTPNKFGQDLPGLEIPLIECSPPPFQRENIKYVVGEPVTTVINLLDWRDENGPLAYSNGWIDVEANEFVETIGITPNGVPYSGNGLPMTDGFDLAVYIKGDRKSTALYNAQLIIEYEGEGPEPPAAFDLAISLSVNDTLTAGSPGLVTATVSNLGPGNLAEEAVVTVNGVTNRGTTFGPYEASYISLPAGTSVAPSFPFVAPSDKSTKIDWIATVSALSDGNPSNDEATATTKVRK